MTYEQMKTCALLDKNGWKQIDIYSDMDILERPIPGILIFYKLGEIGYVEGDGTFYCLEPSTNIINIK